MALKIKSQKKRIIVLLATLIVAATAWYALVAINSMGNKIDKIIGPNYAVLPEGKNIDQLGGWQLLSPPDGSKVYVYSDKLDGIKIKVSQQILPKDFTSNPNAKLSDVAKGYNATRIIDVDGIKVYIGTNAEGPQSVIFIKNGLLVLIKSDKPISDTSYSAYVKSLN